MHTFFVFSAFFFLFFFCLCERQRPGKLFIVLFIAWNKKESDYLQKAYVNGNEITNYFILTLINNFWDYPYLFRLVLLLNSSLTSISAKLMIIKCSNVFFIYCLLYLIISCGPVGVTCVIPPINDPRPKGDRLTRQFVATQVIPEAK